MINNACAESPIINAVMKLQTLYNTCCPWIGTCPKWRRVLLRCKTDISLIFWEDLCFDAWNKKILLIFCDDLDVRKHDLSRVMKLGIWIHNKWNHLFVWNANVFLLFPNMQIAFWCSLWNISTMRQGSVPWSCYNCSFNASILTETAYFNAVVKVLLLAMITSKQLLKQMSY